MADTCETTVTMIERFTTSILADLGKSSIFKVNCTIRTKGASSKILVPATRVFLTLIVPRRDFSFTITSLLELNFTSYDGFSECKETGVVYTDFSKPSKLSVHCPAIASLIGVILLANANPIY
uniref:Uncharacterized protein n=1 Tax=Glossina pallidipes TaxID=7398 RepID=A0A1A9ZVB2_GLOPL